MKRGFFALLACVLLVSCSKMPEMQQYTLTITADKSADTKALYIDSTGALKATWAEGETVQVIRPGTGEALGTLTAQSSGKSTTLSGTISGSFAVGNTLRLEFLSSNYTSQNGLLNGHAASIERTCDYATAEVKILSIAGSTITTEEAHFNNRQAIMKFSLKHNNAPLVVSQLSITVTGEHQSITISVVPPLATDQLYVAIPCYYDNTFSFSIDAVDKDSNPYHKDIGSKTLANGKFYNVTLNL